MCMFKVFFVSFLNLLLFQINRQYWNEQQALGLQRLTNWEFEKVSILYLFFFCGLGDTFFRSLT